MPSFKYRGVVARQSAEHKVVTIAARASEVFAFATITRAGRDRGGSLHGFQRPGIASHIREISDYLATPDAVLPNSVVVGFVDGIRIREISRGLVEVTLEAPGDPPGFIIDGQQRLTALERLPKKDFELFVSLLVCRDLDELRRQFVLLNNTRALPKALIYELLPGTAGLPTRLSSRSLAAQLTERLNFDPCSSLRGKIYQYTNPAGLIRDTAIQQLIMRSVSNGAIRELPPGTQFAGGFQLVSEFFAAVREIFRSDWEGHTPRTSRLVHGAGVQALGFVMELLITRDGAQTRRDFAQGLAVLHGRTAWTSGSWRFSGVEQLRWDRLENTNRQIMALADYLVRVVRRDRRRELRREPAPTIRAQRQNGESTTIHSEVVPISTPGEGSTAAHDEPSAGM